MDDESVIFYNSNAQRTGEEEHVKIIGKVFLGASEAFARGLLDHNTM